MEGVYVLDDFELQSGIVLPNAKISYSIHGELNENRDNVIVYPTYSGSRHTDNEAFLEGRSRSKKVLHCRARHVLQRSFYISEQLRATL